jgi:hypothetical protein
MLPSPNSTAEKFDVLYAAASKVLEIGRSKIEIFESVQLTDSRHQMIVDLVRGTVQELHRDRMSQIIRPKPFDQPFRPTRLTSLGTVLAILPFEVVVDLASRCLDRSDGLALHPRLVCKPAHAAAEEEDEHH